MGVILVIMCIFLGCSQKDDGSQKMLKLRQSILEADGCSFTSEITADFGDGTYTFEMFCQTDGDGNLSFEVLEPQVISGITGRFGETVSDLTFDGFVLAFPRLADGRLTPVSASWIFMKALRSGYIYGFSSDDDRQILLHDTYEDDAFSVNVWLDGQGLPSYAEIVWQEERVITLRIKDFVAM